MNKRIIPCLGALMLILTLLCSCIIVPEVPQQGSVGSTYESTVGSDAPSSESQAEETVGQTSTQDQPSTSPDTDGPTTNQPTTEETTTQGQPSEEQSSEELTTEQTTTEQETEEPSGPPADPYVNMSAAEFYSDYEPADDYWDAYWRTKHGFMSGSIDPQDQAPTIAEYRPMEDGKYVRNTYAYFSSDGNTYYIVNGYGEVVNQVFKGGAYVSLEEVAAYVFAFGDIPVNYSSSKSTKPSESIWGKYLRVNHTKFSGSTSKYPYEPELPDISGCGGSLQYYEIDIGTTGTDCDPSYSPALYNNGSKITRGAARIVYARFDANGDKIIDINERYLFYTYNHYNDFQEYLNYEGGWGEMFGNITGGGTISSKYDYNPTPYVPVVRRDLVSGAQAVQADDEIVVLYYDPKFVLYCMGAYDQV